MLTSLLLNMNIMAVWMTCMSKYKSNKQKDMSNRKSYPFTVSVVLSANIIHVIYVYTDCINHNTDISFILVEIPNMRLNNRRQKPL